MPLLSEPNLPTFTETGISVVGVHGAKKKKRKRKIGSLLASLPPERNVTWLFDGLEYYDRLPIHPPKHGLPANCAFDS